MTIYEELDEYNGTRPFVPFWVSLVNGETIEITEPNMAVVTRQQMVFTPDREKLRRIPIEQITSHGQGSLNANGGTR